MASKLTKKSHISILAVIALGFFMLTALYLIQTAKAKNTKKYHKHKNITATVFWVGEGATADNDYISNSESAWDEYWMEHYGGTDDPVSRNGYYPAGFTPQENPFYVALPYNDFHDDGTRKSNARKTVYWGKRTAVGENESYCKNRWVKIQKKNRVVYAQWEDSGPYQYNNKSYVFGKKKPKNRENNRAGIDVSPAVRDYLGLSDIDQVNWQFVDESKVPDGPWKEIVTTSQISWD